MRLTLVTPVLLGFLVAAACSGSNTSQVSGGGASSGNGSAASGNGTGTGGTDLNVGSGGSAASGNGTGTGTGGSGSLGPDGGCVGTKANGEPIPVDLFFMVDTTGSMNCPVPDDPNAPACEVDPGPPYSSTTRWTVESAALKAFVGDSANNGLGMGIRFFPGNKNLCSANTYATPAVEIAALPGAATALNTAIDTVTPAGQTPTEASLGGALQHAAAWAKAHPTHRVAVVYSTDGYPMGCAGDSIDAAAALADTAFKATPSIPTYVLGVGPNLTDLEKIATAGSGGKTKAFLIDTTKNAATQLSTALASIRTSQVVGCTYTIPPPPSGMMLDPTLVNVQYTDPAGKVTEILQDPMGVICASGTGWEYSTDMSQILLCGAACNMVKAAPGGSVQVRFGCKTDIGSPVK